MPMILHGVPLRGADLEAIGLVIILIAALLGVVLLTLFAIEVIGRKWPDV